LTVVARSADAVDPLLLLQGTLLAALHLAAAPMRGAVAWRHLARRCGHLRRAARRQHAAA
jgi:hypothetical protein